MGSEKDTPTLENTAAATSKGQQAHSQQLIFCPIFDGCMVASSILPSQTVQLLKTYFHA